MLWGEGGVGIDKDNKDREREMMEGNQERIKKWTPIKKRDRQTDRQRQR